MGPAPDNRHVQREEIESRIGLLSMTLASSPTKRHVIPARLRDQNKDDFVCFSKDFIQLFEIDHDGHPTHIATKDDFDAEIVLANAIGYFRPYENGFDESQEDSDMCSNASDGPMGPQMLAFTLSKIAQLFFLTARDDNDGQITFRLSCIPLPAFNTQPRLLSNRIAVDDRSRALAIPTSEHDVLICHANQAELLSTGQRWNDGFIPVSSSRNIRVEGTILLMDFLFPPKHDPDRVILLMIVLHETGIRPAWVEWSHSEQNKSADLRLCHRIFPRKHLSLPAHHLAD